MNEPTPIYDELVAAFHIVRPEMRRTLFDDIAAACIDGVVAAFEVHLAWAAHMDDL
jgi:hypothetical protein